MFYFSLVCLVYAEFPLQTRHGPRKIEISALRLSAPGSEFAGFFAVNVFSIGLVASVQSK